MAVEDESGWEDVTDPADVPKDVQKALGVAGVRKAMGVDGSGQGGKALPAWAATPYEKQIGIYGQIAGSAGGFKDEYGGNTITGGLENTIQGAFSGFGSEGQRDWWAQFKSADNVVRNSLFGAALTPAEQKAYEATTVTPSMDSKEIRRNLASRREILRKALGRKTNFLRKQGYSNDAIDALAGEYAPDFNPELQAAEQTADPAADPAAAAQGAPNTPLGAGDIGFEAEAKPQGFSEPQIAAYNTFMAANPKATAEQIRAFGNSLGQTINNADEIVQARDAGAGVADARGAVVQAPDISDVRGEGGVGETARAFIRGIPGAIGLDDEVNALVDGDSLSEVLSGEGKGIQRERAIRDYDEENHFWSRLSGSLAAGALVPTGDLATIARAAATGAIRQGLGREAAILAARRAVAIRTGKEGAAVGAAFGVGDADGGVGDRLGNGVLNATIGGAAGFATGNIGNRLANRGGGPGAPRGGSSQEAQEFGRAAERIGADYLPADVPGNTAGPIGTRMATGVSRVTLGGIPLAEAAQKTIQSARAAKERIAQGMGLVGDNASTGQAAQRGARDFVRKSEARGSELYEAIPIAPQRRAVLSNTRTALEEMTQGMESNPALSKLWTENPRLQATLDALTVETSPMRKAMNPSLSGTDQGSQVVGTNLSGGQLSWTDMKRFRSIVGEIAGRPSLSSDGSDIASMKKLYGALSEDMRATAAADGPSSLRAFERANRYWKGREGRIDNVLSEVLGDDLNKGAEAAFQRINSLASLKGGNATKLAQLVRSLPEDDAATVKATVLDRLGVSSAGRQDAAGAEWSPAEFLTHWNGLAPRAKSVLFDGEHRQAINDLALVSEGMKKSSQFTNTSLTSLGTNGLALAGAAMANPLLAVALGGTQFAAGKLLASKRMAVWLTRAPKKPNPPAMLAHIKQLTGIARSEPQIAKDVLGLQEVLAQAFTASPSRAAAAPGQDDQK